MSDNSAISSSAALNISPTTDATHTVSEISILPIGRSDNPTSARDGSVNCFKFALRGVIKISTEQGLTQVQEIAKLARQQGSGFRRVKVPRATSAHECLKAVLRLKRGRCAILGTMKPKKNLYDAKKCPIDDWRHAARVDKCTKSRGHLQDQNGPRTVRSEEGLSSMFCNINKICTVATNAKQLDRKKPSHFL